MTTSNHSKILGVRLIDHQQFVHLIQQNGEEVYQSKKSLQGELKRLFHQWKLNIKTNKINKKVIRKPKRKISIVINRKKQHKEIVLSSDEEEPFVQFSEEDQRKVPHFFLKIRRPKPQTQLLKDRKCTILKRRSIQQQLQFLCYFEDTEEQLWQNENQLKKIAPYTLCEFLLQNAHHMDLE